MATYGPDGKRAVSGVAIRASDWPLTGRDEELRKVLTTLEDARGGAVILGGQAGVGKTRLMREVGRVMNARGTTVIHVAATSSGRGIPLSAFAPVLHDEELGTSSDLLGLVRAAAAALRRRAGAGHLLVAVDDAHLLDPTSAVLVNYLVTATLAKLVATIRSGSPCPDAVTNLWKDHRALRLELTALSRDQVATLLTLALGGQVRRASCDEAYRRSEGNPLFLHEFILGALETGALSQCDGLWHLEPTASASTRLVELVSARMGSLEPRSAYACQLLAVGEPLPIRAFEFLVDEQLIQALEKNGLIRMTDDLEVQLGHPLYGEMLRDGTGRVQGRRFRQQLADALQAISHGHPDDAVRIATWRLDAGEPCDTRLLLVAAQRARVLLDHPSAARLASAALEAGGGWPARLIAAGAARALGRLDQVEELLAKAEADVFGASVADARHYLFLRTATLQWGLGRTADAADLLARARDWIDDSVWRHAVDGLWVNVLATGGRHTEAVEIGRRLIDESDAPISVRLPAMASYGYALAVTGRPLESLERLDELMAEASAAGGVPMEWPIEVTWAQTALFAGLRWDEADRSLARRHRTAVASEDSGTAAIVELAQSQLALGRGLIDVSIHRLRDVTAQLTMRDTRNLASHAHALLALAFTQAADLASAETELERAKNVVASGQGGSIFDVAIVEASIWTAGASGQLEAARRQCEEFIRRVPDLALMHGLLWISVLRVGYPAKDVAGYLRTAQQAARCPRLDTMSALAEAAAAGDGRSIEQAAEDLTAMGALLHAAEAYAMAASAYHAAGRPERMRVAALRRDALSANLAGADTPLLRRAPQVSSLTKREYEVAALAARGHSNTEIAQALVLSVRTVESHLYRGSAKLGIQVRGEFADVLLPGLAGSSNATP